MYDWLISQEGFSKVTSQLDIMTAKKEKAKWGDLAFRGK